VKSQAETPAPRAVVVYFSQSGTTAQVAERIAAGLRDAGYAVDLSNLRDGPPADVGSYDIIGIGSPVYYFRLPFNVTDYLASLPPIRGKPVFCFLVHGSHAFDAANTLRQFVVRRGATDVGYFRCYGEAYFLGHLKEGYLFSPDHPSTRELERATAFGTDVATRAAKGQRLSAEDEPDPPLAYRLERRLMNRWLVENLYSRLFKVDPDKCTACGKCIDICPTKNIVENEQGRPLWGRQCLYCLSCEMQCPEDAISSVISRPVTRFFIRPFLRYNVKNWVREPELDHVAVVHAKGQTRRVRSESTGGGQVIEAAAKRQPD
jgi:flavodoxin/Fe-S-cluster-containing hydrogenase component 2